MVVMLGFRFTVKTVTDGPMSVVHVSLLYFVVRVRCRHKKFTFTISSSDELLVISAHLRLPDNSRKALYVLPLSFLTP